MLRPGCALPVLVADGFVTLLEVPEPAHFSRFAARNLDARLYQAKVRGYEEAEGTDLRLLKASLSALEG